MTEKQKKEYKKKLKKKCIAIIEERLANIHISMAGAQAAANYEEKGSAGDKYETSRAMSHLEKDMQATQLSSNMRELESLLLVDCNQLYETAVKGSVVQCETILFFIAAGLGKLTCENQTIFLVSPNAPIAKSLLGKKAGDSINFNKKNIIIKGVY